MISQNNFYPNWTSELYTSDTVARTLPKMFYKGEVLKNFLNTSKFDSINTRLVEELCIEDVDVRLMSVSDENPTTWPESTIGIVVITVCAFLLLLFLMCWICVCCLRKAENKEE